MSRTRKIIVSIVSVFVLLIGIYIAVNYFSYKRVSFELSDNTSSITVYLAEGDNEESVVATLDQSGDVRLKPGNYIVTPTGDKIVTTPIAIEVTSDTDNFSIDPYFSEEYVASAFSEEVDVINNTLLDAYATIKGLTVKEGVFAHFGDWYIASVYITPQPRLGMDTYGVILQKNGMSWDIIGDPTIVFTYEKYDSVPKDIIQKANSLVNIY